MGLSPMSAAPICSAWRRTISGYNAALTAGRLGAADSILCGLADLCVRAESLPALAAALTECDDGPAVTALLQAHAETAPDGALEAARGWIKHIYAADTVEEIVAGLKARPETEAHAAEKEIAGKSPTSLKVALRLLHEARGYGALKPCLQQEYDAALASMKSHDFVEGVRAAVVDKDRNPRWSPATLAEVTPEMVDAYFVRNVRKEGLLF